jgi:hypothetical protein
LFNLPVKLQAISLYHTPAWADTVADNKIVILFVSMLPVLGKNQEREREFRPADTKLYNPPRELSLERPRLPLHDYSRNSAKSKYSPA